MRVLIVGGSGYVAGLILPALTERHTVRIFDLKPPADPALDYHPGNVGDLAALTQAAEGMDALLYMAMGAFPWNTDEVFASSFDANVKGVYLALYAAHQAGIPHAVYTSSMSVYDGDLLIPDRFPSEDIPPDADHFYGFTKRLGEECCRLAVRQWGMSVNALRLCLPVSEEKWLAETRKGVPTIATTAPDVARAILAALDYRDGFQAFMISGDYEQTSMNMSKARCLLNWEPLARPRE